MKKNVIMITIDAFFYHYIGEKSNKKSCTPFLDKLIKNKNTISIKNMYSESPYTEAALMSLLGGTDTCDNGSYMKRLSKTDCILKMFQNDGYTVFANCYQSSIYPSGALTGVNDLYYNSSFSFSCCWDYRIKYYSKLIKTKKLKDQEYNLIEDILDDNFKEAKTFLNCLKTKSKKVELIYECLDVDNLYNDIELVEKEYNKYLKDKKKYINNLFKLGDNHPMNKLYSYPFKNKIRDKKILAKIEKEFMPIVKKIYWKNVYYNFKNNHISLKKLYLLLKNSKKNAKEYLKNHIASIIDVDLKDRVRAKTYNKIKTVASANTSFNHFIKWYNSKNYDNSFFAYLHIDDIHFREMFFTHDTTNLDLLKEEFQYINDYIKKIPKNYKGSIAYDLGVHYVDKQIEKLFKFLEEKDLLKNTDIIITADHGNSYTYQNIRENYVNNFYEENYHVPCIIYSKNCKFKINQENFYQTKDIPATILNMNNITIPTSYKGKSMTNFNGRDYAVSEYSGSGCPDLINRPIQISIRTKKYNVVGEVFLKNINTLKIKEVYDLANDKNENINLVYKKKLYKIDKELKLMKKEISNIQNSNKKILQ